MIACRYQPPGHAPRDSGKRYKKNNNNSRRSSAASVVQSSYHNHLPKGSTIVFTRELPASQNTGQVLDAADGKIDIHKSSAINSIREHYWMGRRGFAQPATDVRTIHTKTRHILYGLAWVVRTTYNLIGLHRCHGWKSGIEVRFKSTIHNCRRRRHDWVSRVWQRLRGSSLWNNVEKSESGSFGLTDRIRML